MAYPRTGYPPYLPTYDRNLTTPGSMYNPDNTNPFPPPGTTPVSGWTSGPSVRLQFTAGPSPVLGSEAVTTCTWQSPVFDLRPERRAMDPQDNLRNRPYAQAVWGAGANLYIQILGLQRVADGLTDLVINEQEIGAVSIASLTAFLASPQDISDQVVGISFDSAMITITPPGSGSPPRYWQAVLTFDKLSATAVPDLEIVAAYY